MSLDFSASAIAPDTGFLGDIGNPLSHATLSSSSSSEEPETLADGDEIELVKHGVAPRQRYDADETPASNPVTPLHGGDAEVSF